MLKPVYYLCGLVLVFIAPSTWALSIAMVVWRGETDAEKGFLDELKALGYQPTITVYNAQQNQRTLALMVRNELRNNIEQYDYIYTFGTTVTKVVKQHFAGEKPHIFNVVSYPVREKIVVSKNGGQRNIAGVSNSVLTSLQLSNASKVLDVKKIAFVFNPRETNSSLQLQDMLNVSKEQGYEVVPLRVRPDVAVYREDLAKVSAIQGLSAVYLPSDSFLISHAKDVLALFNEKKIPTICSAAPYLKEGCLVGTSSNYIALGRIAAGILDQHQKGQPLEEMPVMYDANAFSTINEDVLQALGL